MKISYRAQTLITLRNLEKALDRPVMFNELVEACDFERQIVSKSLDSLDDMGLINQKNASWIVHEGKYAKGMTTAEVSRGFIDETIRQNAKLERTTFDSEGKVE